MIDTISARCKRLAIELSDKERTERAASNFKTLIDSDDAVKMDSEPFKVAP